MISGDVPEEWEPSIRGRAKNRNAPTVKSLGKQKFGSANQESVRSRISDSVRHCPVCVGPIDVSCFKLMVSRAICDSSDWTQVDPDTQPAFFAKLQVKTVTFGRVRFGHEEDEGGSNETRNDRSPEAAGDGARIVRT